MIFPDQDGEGTFAVRATLNGPDLYVLNKEIEDIAEIIGVEYGERSLIPPVPHMDAFNSNFEVNDVLADVVGEWLEMIWKKGNVKEFKKSVTICADEDYGMKLPIELN